MTVVDLKRHKYGDTANLHLTSIFKSLVTIRYYYLLMVQVNPTSESDRCEKILSTLGVDNPQEQLVLDAIRSHMTDIVHCAKLLLHLDSVSSEQLQKFHLLILSSLDVKVYTDYPNLLKRFETEVLDIIYPAFASEFENQAV